MGHPHPDLGWDTPPPHPDLEWGNPPPVEVWTDTQSENITFPHPSDAGCNKVRLVCQCHYLGDRSRIYSPDLDLIDNWLPYKVQYFLQYILSYLKNMNAKKLAQLL